MYIFIYIYCHEQKSVSVIKRKSLAITVIDFHQHRIACLV